MTTPETLARIKKKYPEAFKALPKGWRFLNIGEKLCKNDRVWSWGKGPFKAPETPWEKQKEVDMDHHPIIRRVRSKKNELTWPSNVPKDGPLKGCIYIGMGNSKRIEGLSAAKSWGCFEAGNGISCDYFDGNAQLVHYFIPPDHPIAHRYIKTTKTQKPTLKDLKTKILELERENAALKEKLAKIHKESLV